MHSSTLQSALWHHLFRTKLGRPKDDQELVAEKHHHLDDQRQRHTVKEESTSVNIDMDWD